MTSRVQPGVGRGATSRNVGRNTRWAAALAILCVVLPNAASAQGLASCSVASQNLFVREVLSDIYLWSEHLPSADPVQFASPEAYLDAVRYRPLDSHFSYITSRAENDAFFQASQYVGLGASWGLFGRELRIMEVFPGTPASEAGLVRGDRVTAIDGRTIADLVASDALETAIGPSTPGAATTLTIVSAGSGRALTARLVRREITMPTVSHTHRYQVEGRRIGYVFFRNFVQPSPAALDAAFADLTAAGMDELVLDLRYNGGGLVSVARHLASLIGGVKTSGQVMATYAHNPANAWRNEVMRFDELPNALTLSRLVVITTPASASASELIINALRPFMPVTVVGDRTYGKPVGQYQIGFCDRMLAPVSFTLRNANNEGDYFDGIAADCVAADDLDHQLGDPAEASLREALTVIATGACSVPPTARAREATAPGRTPRATGWQSVINAR